MKSISFVILTIFCTVGIQAQVRPFLTDIPSSGGSTSNLLKYGDLKRREDEIQDELEKFKRDYLQRLIYLETATSSFVTDYIDLKSKINTEIQNTLVHHTRVNTENEKLSSVFAYSEKKDNRKKLAVILKMINTMQKELSNQVSFNVVYGEKLNLYQNTNHSLTEISRLLDAIENNIERSKLINKILN